MFGKRNERTPVENNAYLIRAYMNDRGQTKTKPNFNHPVLLKIDEALKNNNMTEEIQTAMSDFMEKTPEIQTLFDKYNFEADFEADSQVIITTDAEKKAHLFGKIMVEFSGDVQLRARTLHKEMNDFAKKWLGEKQPPE